LYGYEGQSSTHTHTRVKKPEQQRSDGRPENGLLAALPAAEYRRLLPLLKVEPLKFKQTLQGRDEKVRDVYFPNGGVCSVTSVMEDGRFVEVATIGKEGLVGALPFLADDKPVGESMVQVPVPDMSAHVMSITAFKHEIDQRSHLYNIVQQWSQAFFAMVMQTVACNGLHTVEERCARWLLQTHDRVGSDEFLLTQEFLAMMLGVRRPSVTIVAGTLQKAGLITYGHKKIQIRDRQGLEAASCECYKVTKAHFDRNLPKTTGR
jgi:CRP-like cAMP-binding protein